MVKALFDTNILIDHLNGVAEARNEIALYEDPSISLITWMEVLVGAGSDLVSPTRAFLRRFRILPIDEATADVAVALRRTRRLRLPDSIIWASAIATGRLFVTRNTRDFPEDDPGIRAPYRL
jgi:predicted nucleic acid-binding protein